MTYANAKLFTCFAIAFTTSGCEALRTGKELNWHSSKITLSVDIQANSTAGLDNVLLGLIWVDVAQLSRPREHLTSTYLLSGHSPPQATIEGPPPNGAVRYLAQPMTTIPFGLAWAELVLVDDVDRNGTFSVLDRHITEPDHLVGSSEFNALLYLAKGTEHPVLGFSGDVLIRQGYQLVEIDCFSPTFDGSQANIVESRSAVAHMKQTEAQSLVSRSRPCLTTF